MATSIGNAVMDVEVKLVEKRHANYLCFHHSPTRCQPVSTILWNFCPMWGEMEPGIGQCHFRRVQREHCKPSQLGKLPDIGQNTEAMSLMPTV
jgi:hypothetical protein